MHIKIYNPAFNYGEFTMIKSHAGLKGYVETKELLQVGFSNRQIAILTEENYLGSYLLNNRNTLKLEASLPLIQ